jgi:hypothetical protein
MSDNLQKFRPAYLKIQEDMDRLTRIVKPSYLSIYKQIERSLEPIRQQHLELTRSLELSGRASSYLSEIANANQRWQDLIDKATASSRVFEDLKHIDQSWLDTIKPMHDSIAQLQASAKLSLSDVAFRLTVTEGLFTRIDFEALKRCVALPEAAFLQIQDAIGGITATYEHLADSIRSFPELTQLPAFTLPGATRELFTTSYALDELHITDESQRERGASEIQLIAEVEEETSVCIRLLQKVDPALALPYIGAHDALRGKSVDRTRHVLSSLRELWNHVLRRIAQMRMSWLGFPALEMICWMTAARRGRCASSMCAGI